MAKIQVTILCLLTCLTVSAQRYEKVPFGDFEQWAVRYITESKVIGGRKRLCIWLVRRIPFEGTWSIHTKTPFGRPRMSMPKWWG